MVRTIERAAHEMNQKGLKAGQFVNIQDCKVEINQAERLTSCRDRKTGSIGGYYCPA
jgi:hypothetical protein